MALYTSRREREVREHKRVSWRARWEGHAENAFTTISWTICIHKTLKIPLSLSLSLVNTHNYINKCVWQTVLTMGITMAYGQHNYINKCVWQTILMMGIMMAYGHRYATWVVEHVELPIGTANTVLRNWFLFVPTSNQEICHISTPFNFHGYTLTPCVPSNAKELHNTQLWCNSQYLNK